MIQQIKLTINHHSFLFTELIKRDFKRQVQKDCSGQTLSINVHLVLLLYSSVSLIIGAFFYKLTTNATPTA